MKLSKKAAILAAAMSLNFTNQVSEAGSDRIDYNGKQFIDFEFFDEGEFTSQYTLDQKLKNALKTATDYWVGILAPRSKFSSPWQIPITTQANYKNAMAGTLSFSDKKNVTDNYVMQLLQTGKTLNSFNMAALANTSTTNEDADKIIMETLPEGDVSFSSITIGQHMGANREGAIDGWWIDEGDTIIPLSEQAADFIGTFRHELGHALGISARMENCDWDGNNIPDEQDPVVYDTSHLVLKKFADDIADENNWIFHLIDQNGNHAKAGMIVTTTSGFNLLKEQKPDAVESDYFIVDLDKLAYFVGDNVTEALGGAKYDNISGLPVNSWESQQNSTNSFEGSHIETPGMMSHRPYRNYTTFMEVELALMQDLGYDFDRKAYYGSSIYTNNGTINSTQGYSARNSDGTAYTSDYSQIPLGVGLHLYGTNNTVTQSANILTRGTGAVGIRVDGVENNLTIPKSTEIHADGTSGKGILFAYGRNHVLNLNGTVTATGSGGNAVEFNFGSNLLGADNEYRGSYIRYQRGVNVETGEIIASTVPDLTDMSQFEYNYSADELNGEIVTDFNLSGKISGGKNAVYIANNAFVKNINVNNGAEINGDITSDWKHFTEDEGVFSRVVQVVDTEEGNVSEIIPLVIPYGGTLHIYNMYVPDLVTNLNFNSTMAYSGNITGADNIKMNILGNDLVYGGTANVLNVNVAKGAGLFGGTFNLNDVSANLAEGFSDDTTGKFYNHGTIGSAYSDKTMTINGDLISDGTLSGYGGGSLGNIVVNGAANVEGSTISAVNLAPDESMTVLTAQSITGKIANSENNPNAISGLLSGYGEIVGNSINYKTAVTNNIGVLDSEQNEAFSAVKNMSTALKSDSRKSQILPLYSLDSAGAGNALSQIGNSDAAQMMSAIQQSSVANTVISDRLATAFSTGTVNFNVGGMNFADGDDTILMGVSADYPTTADNNFWVKFTKNWGELKGGADYHGSAISGGYDRAFGENWRGGLFVSYNTMSLANKNFGGSLHDTRGGIYFGYHNDVDNAFLYIDGGKVRNNSNRSISALGLSTSARYNSNIFEIGGEYKRNLTPEKSWSVSPFINLQYSHLKQHAYNETGAGIFNQHVGANSNGYFAGQLGVEFKRVLSHGNYAARIGVKHAFTGADPELNFRYEGDNSHFYTLKNNQDKTHFVMSIGGENEFHGGWILGGDVAFQKGAHDKDLSASVMLRKVW